MAEEQLAPVIVTGASGGVGSVAIDLLSGRGYEVIALSRKLQATDYLQSLGATDVLDAKTAADSGKPLEAARWAGAIDNVGGAVLGWLTRTVQPWGSIASIGLAGGEELHTTVMPFILRNVKLCGVDSVVCPIPRREEAWRRMAELLPESAYADIGQVASLEEVPDAAARIMKGQVQGRVLIDPNK